MLTKQSGTSLICYEDDIPVAQLIWNIDGRSWYINFLSVERPNLLVPLLAKFRSLWYTSGRPPLMFHASSDNEPMKRLISLLEAECSEGVYKVKSI